LVLLRTVESRLVLRHEVRKIRLASGV